MKKFIKISSLAVVVALLATIVSGFMKPALAHENFPNNIWEWDQEDWNRFYSYQNQNQNQNRPADGWYNGRYYYYNGNSWYFIGEDGCSYSCDPPYGYNNYNYANSNNGYNNYNYYGGILNVYDGASEYQASILAKIIYLYGHGVASQTQQACIGWTVMNSVDLSTNTDIGSIAPLFHYDANKPTVDDFGRNLMPLARDIIFRWKAGRSGVQNNGRVLPAGYCYVWSTGSTVAFRSSADQNSPAWGYSYTSPYGN